MTESELVGSFDLVSWRRTDGTEPFGPDPRGHLWYGPDGRMAVQFASANREPIGLPMDRLMELKPMLKKPWQLLAHRELLSAFKRYLAGVSNFMAYGGTYEVKGSTVVHCVELALIPDWDGQDLVREAEKRGDTLALTTPDGDTLIWARTPGT